MRGCVVVTSTSSIHISSLYLWCRTLNKIVVYSSIRSILDSLIDGVVLCGHVDASFRAHDDCKSHSGGCFSVGETASSSIHSNIEVYIFVPFLC